MPSCENIARSPTMAKKRDRIVNTQPFISDDASVASSRKRSKVPKTHQKQEKVSQNLHAFIFQIQAFRMFQLIDFWGFLQLIEAGMSSKIMKQALAQQKEVADEENAERNPSSAAFAVAGAATAVEEQRVLEEEDDIDEFDGTFDNQSQFDKQVSFLILYSISFRKLLIELLVAMPKLILSCLCFDIVM